MKRKKSPADRVTEASKPIKKPHWRASALAAATVGLLGFASVDANALALGRITVQSALGEPLRADIDIPEINAEELASLKVQVAPPEAFRSAGLEYSSSLGSLQITLQRRPDGRYYLRLVGDRPVNDPFIDLILQTNWASGRIIRDYTLLFDPPNLRQAAPPAVAAQTAPVAPPSAAAQAPVARSAPAAPSRTPAPAARQAARVEPSGDGKQVTVQAGETAGKIAAANKPANVSLDQMLVAILKGNPDAFIGGNVNRLKAGAVLDIPSAEQAAGTSSGEASQSIVAQSRDFNEFRRRLAEGLPATQVDGASRQATGRVQARVEEKGPASATPDKLTLSKGAVQGKAKEDQIARDRAAKDAADRVAELNKNISDLNKLSTGTGTAPAAVAAAASGAKPGVPVATPVAAAVPASAAPAPVAAPSAILPGSSPVTPAAAASAASSPVSATPVSGASAPSPTADPAAVAASGAASAASAVTPQVAVAASAPAAPASAARPAPAPAPVEATLLDDLLDNPLVPAAIGAMLAMLLGLGFYRARQRRKATQVDSSFLESRLQPDSFFGASGGQRIDTNDGNPTGSSMVYSPSQLDAAGDVDPVAEADVYLAYGRDLQAEEILKEALRTTPQRVAIHSKLLEIYAKRRDARAFEVVATEAYSLTHGQGPDWEHICEIGHELDSTNPLYRPGGQPVEGAASAPAPIAAAPAPAPAPTASFAAAMATQVLAPQPSTAPDLDLDLDFSLGDDPVPAGTIDGHAAHRTVYAVHATSTVALAAADSSAMDLPDLDLSDDAPAAAANTPSGGMIEFDLGSLSLDLPGSASSPPESRAPEPDTSGAPISTAGFDDSGSDPLATKLALAQEFSAIGDPDGARSLAEEVIAEASGDLKSRAQRFLAEIG